MSDTEVSIWQKFRDDSLRVIGINNNENLDLIRNFKAAFGLTYPILLDSNGEIYLNYFQFGGTSPFPLDYIIDQQGKIAYFNTEYDPKRMKEIITNLMNPINVEEENVAIPFFHQLDQNYPNPFNPITTIDYFLQSRSDISLIIFNLNGREVARLVDEEKSAGKHSVKWDASNLASGIYFYRLQASDFVQTKKMVLLK